MKDTKIVIAISRSDALAMTRDVALEEVRVYLDPRPFNIRHKATAIDSFKSSGLSAGDNAQLTGHRFSNRGMEIRETNLKRIGI